MSSLTPEQRREHWRSETVAGLWGRWYASGPDDLSRGWDDPERGFIILTRADVRDLDDYLRAEYGDDPRDSE